MKYLLLSITILSALTIQAQELKHSRSGFESLVFKAEGKKTSEIYSNLKAWIQSSFVNPDEAITADTENKTLRFNGYFEIEGLVAVGFKYTCLIEIKEGKYRMSLQNVRGVANNDPVEGYLKKDGSVRGLGKKQYYKMFNHLQGIANDLHSASTGVAEEDW